MAELYFLLFLFAASGSGGLASYEGPIGIFRSMGECRSHGAEVTKVVMRKFDCLPATETALRYFQGVCLGKPEDCKLIGR